jgi:hypothetical protein
MLEKGTCQSILKRDFIDVWKSPWIPSVPLFKFRPNVNLVDFPDYFVTDFILHGNRLWNVDLLNDLSIQNILQIHNFPH